MSDVVATKLLTLNTNTKSVLQRVPWLNHKQRSIFRRARGTARIARNLWFMTSLKSEGHIENHPRLPMHALDESLWICTTRKGCKHQRRPGFKNLLNTNHACIHAGRNR